MVPRKNTFKKHFPTCNPSDQQIELMKLDQAKKPSNNRGMRFFLLLSVLLHLFMIFGVRGTLQGTIHTPSFGEMKIAFAFQSDPAATEHPSLPPPPIETPPELKQPDPTRDVQALENEPAQQDETLTSLQDIADPEPETVTTSRATPLSEGIPGNPEPLGIDQDELQAYLEEINRLIHQARRSYPDIARRLGHQGTVILRLTINRNGAIHKIDISQHSGYQALDESAEKIIRRSGPFPSFPQSLNINSLTIDIPFQFNLLE